MTVYFPLELCSTFIGSKFFRKSDPFGYQTAPASPQKGAQLPELKGFPRKPVITRCAGRGGIRAREAIIDSVPNHLKY